MPMLPPQGILQARAAFDPAPGGGSGFSAEAQQFLDRIDDPGDPRKALYAGLIDSLVAAGIWAKLDALYVFAADSEANALVNLRQGAFAATKGGTPTFTVDRGFTGGTNDYLDTNFNPTTAVGAQFTRDSACLFAWSRTAGQVGAPIIGMAASSNNYIYPRFTDNVSYNRTNRGTSSSTYASTDGAGLRSSNRSASNATQCYHQGAQVDTDTDASTALVNNNFVILQANGSAWYTGECAAAGFGASLDATEQDALYDILQTYMTAVGA
jgi:hypothetical protein